MLGGANASFRYATELLKSEYCLHFRGDTTTSRRVYDAIAAGCVPVIVSDNTHVPFTSSINWNAFTVAIPERALLQVSLAPVGVGRWNHHYFSIFIMSIHHSTCT